MQEPNNLNKAAPDPNSPFALLGGAVGVQAIVESFYSIMYSDQQYLPIRKLHPKDLTPSKEKLYLFLSGWLGGPALYIERYGHPMLRARHLPYAIGITERDLWLDCMKRAMVQLQTPPELQTGLLQTFFGTADWMRNQSEAIIP